MTEAAPRLRHDGPKKGPLLVLAHGAGAGMDSDFMETMARGLGERGLHVVRFEFPYMAARREGRRPPPDRAPVLHRTWVEVLDRLGGPAEAVIGGKSMGGRIASMLADEAGVRGLVCLGYPFHAAGREATDARLAHLAALRTPALLVQGERDPMGRRDEVAGYALSDAVRLLWMPDGDHSLKPRKRSGHTYEENLEAAMDAVAAFVRGL